MNSSQPVVNAPTHFRLSTPLIVAIIITLIVLAAAATVLFDSSLRGKFSSPKHLVGYSFTNEEGNKFHILFYRNSKVETQTDPNTGISYKVLVAPAAARGALPTALSIEGHSGNLDAQSSNEIAASESCTTTSGLSKFTTVYLPNVRATASICSSAGLLYTTTFGTGQAVYNILISPQQNTHLTKNQLTEASRHRLNEDDIKAIITSFHPLD